MGRDQPAFGEAGEGHAHDYLLGSFRHLHKSQAGEFVDWDCHGLKHARESSQTYRNPTLRFYIQVKGTKNEFPREISVTRSTFTLWLRHCENQPVFVLFVRKVQANLQEYRFLCFHDWLLKSHGQSAICDRGPTISLKIRDFKESNDGNKFHEDLLKDGDRALRDPGSLWGTLRDDGLLPFDEALFHDLMEFASFAEPPTQVVKLLAKEGLPSVPDITRHLLEKEDSEEDSLDQLLEEWANTLRTIAPAPSQNSFQRRQFRLFRKMMMNFKKGLTLPQFPPFKIDYVSCWRAIIAMYPNSIKMLQYVIRYSQRPGDIKFASAMPPMLALSSDRLIRDQASEAIRLLCQRRDFSSSYSYRRELCRGPAEAGDERSLKEAIKILKSRKSISDEIAFLDDYGWKKEVLQANLDRKLITPTIRDEPLKDFYLAMGDLLL